MQPTPLPVPPGYVEHPVHKNLAVNDAGSVIRRFKSNWRCVKTCSHDGVPRLVVRKNGNGEQTKMLLAEFVLEAHGKPCPDPTYRPFHRNGSRKDCRLCNLEWRPYSAGGYRLKPLGEPERLKRVTGEVDRVYLTLDSRSANVLFRRFVDTNDSVNQIALDTRLSVETVRHALRGATWVAERKAFGLKALEQAAAKRGLSVVEALRTAANA